jgi:hypothetical protein
MAKSKPPRTKSSAATSDIEARLQESLFDRKPAKPAPQEEQPPLVGDKVTFSQSDTVYTISRVSPSGTQVDLRLEGTNIERFRVSVKDLDFVDRRTPRQPPPKPAKPAIDVEAVSERLTAAHHGSMEQLSGDIAILKKYLRSQGVRASVIDELDDLCETTEKRWAAAVEEILDSLRD